MYRGETLMGDKTLSLHALRAKSPIPRGYFRHRQYPEFLLIGGKVARPAVKTDLEGLFSSGLDVVVLQR